jgi:hypothetical protein
VLDLRATLSQMTDIAGEVLGEEADQGSLRDFYLAIRLRVDYGPKHPHCLRLRDSGRTVGKCLCVRGGTSTLPPPPAGTTLTHSWDTAPTH